MAYPKIGDPIPESDLKYDAADIANLDIGTGKSFAPNDPMAPWNIGKPAASTLTNPNQSVAQQQAQTYADSTAIKAKETALGSSIDQYTLPQVDVDNATKIADEQKQMLQDRMDALEQRRIAEIASIESSYQSGKAATEAGQVKEKGATSMGLARMGGYLGGSASQQAVLQNLELTHRNELSLLESKKNDAIRQANNAYSEQDFKLAQEKLNVVKDLDKTIEDRKNNFFNRALNLSQELRASSKDKFDMASKKTDLLATTGETPDTDTLISLANDLGLNTSSTLSFINYKKDLADAKSEQEKYDSYNKIMSVLKNVPKGLTVSMPDGTEVTGMGDAGDIYTSIQKNSETGDAYIISFDKTQNKIVDKKFIGNMGKTSGSVFGPTIYGLNKQQSTDVAIEKTAPQWFVDGLLSKLKEDGLEIDTLDATSTQQFWDEFKKESIATTKSTKEALGTGFTLDFSGASSVDFNAGE